MKKVILLFLTLSILASLNSCLFFLPPIKGNGKVVEVNRMVEDFVQINTSREVNVYISQGDEEKVLVRADENLIDIISTEVDEGILKITTTRRIKNATENKVYITVNKLEKISSFAGSNVFHETPINTEDLEVTCSAGGNLKMELYSTQIKIKASAGSNVFLEGVAEIFEVTASAGSNVKAENLKSKNCEAKATSGANIFLTVDQELKAHAGSGGNVFYKGNPEKLDISSGSGGNVKKNQ